MTVLLLTLILAGLIIFLYISVKRTTKTKFAAIESRSEAGELVADPGEAGLAAAEGTLQASAANSPVANTKGIIAQYGISYAKRIYVDELFTLQVHIAEEGASLSVKAGDRLFAAGELGFIHEWYFQLDPVEPLPKIQVDLTFAEGDFQASSKSQTRAMAPNSENIFSFLVKPLKSSDLLLQVSITYLGVRWQPEKISEITTTEDGSKVTTAVTKIPAQFEPDPQLLINEALIIQVKSFLNMNASALGTASKITAALFTLIYVGIVIYGGLTDSIPGTIFVAVSTLAGIFGIPIADVITNAQIKKEA